MKEALSEIVYPNARPKLSELESALGYTFTNSGLLEEALTHRSFVHESKGVALRSYERLEFLGDAVLELSVSVYLWQAYPNLPEGDLTRLRAELVKKMTLAGIAQQLDLGPHLRLGKGEKLRGGAERASILADTIEAILGAVFLDGGFPLAQEVCMKLLESNLEGLDPTNLPNYKNRLQELAASKQLPMPRYQLLHVEGPEHQPTFVMEALIPPDSRAEGHGRNKKRATQEAAKKLLFALQEGTISDQEATNEEQASLSSTSPDPETGAQEST
ncbi:MAG: ribonuclease III [Deltaproteobacteria bacterium]|nr:MAG: ribonuclease III [Deltaproteobacteria bacterium]